jgi:hypothetical protein
MESEKKDEQLRQLFGLGPRDDIGPSAHIEASTFNVCDADWNHLPVFSHAQQYAVSHFLSNNPQFSQTQRFNVEEFMSKPRADTTQVIIIGRKCVLQEIGGYIHNKNLEKAVGYDGTINVECNDTLDDAATQEVLDVALAFQNDSYPLPPRDKEGRPIIVLRKDEEQGSTAYGDVAFCWPVVDPVENDVLQSKNLKRQFDINCSVLGLNPVSAAKEFSEFVSELIHDTQDNHKKQKSSEN